MQLKLGWGTYLFFGCWCFVAAVFSYFMVPETAKKTLEEIAEIFGDKAPGAEHDILQRIADDVWNSRPVDRKV